jgi:hypothetical protein
MMLMTMQPLASIINHIEHGHVVHIEVVITMPQTIRVWIHVVAVVHPQHLQGYDALIKMIRLYPNLMPTSMIKTECIWGQVHVGDFTFCSVKVYF